jgi:hypothetical protein
MRRARQADPFTVSGRPALITGVLTWLALTVRRDLALLG